MEYKHTLICKNCGKEFGTNKRVDTRYCSNACRYNTSAKSVQSIAFREKRREWLNSVKLKAGCALCGYNTHPAALHFDHLDPASKSFNISQDPKRAMSSLLEEIDKCRVLCANCHAIHTHTSNQYTLRTNSETNNKGAIP